MTIRILTEFFTQPDPDYCRRPKGFISASATPYVPGRVSLHDPAGAREEAMREWLEHVKAGRLG